MTYFLYVYSVGVLISEKNTEVFILNDIRHSPNLTWL
jgi:hypothetical protein